MSHHPREQRSFVETPAGFSRRLDDLIERLIDMRDALDMCDADLEDEPDDEAGGDEEPSLGWTDAEARWNRYGDRCDHATGAAYALDAEQDESDRETGLNELWPTQSQDVPTSVRGLRAGDDDEDGHDAEHDTSDSEATLGWSEAESLSGDLHAGSPLGEDEDSDEDADIADQPHDWNELEEGASGTPDYP